MTEEMTMIKVNKEVSKRIQNIKINNDNFKNANEVIIFLLDKHENQRKKS